jgi:hypothetical protein
LTRGSNPRRERNCDGREGRGSFRRGYVARGASCAVRGLEADDGGAASGVDGRPDPAADQLEALAGLLEPEFCLNRAEIAEAPARRSTFNAIHDLTAFKIDFFIKGPAPFDAGELRRSIRQAVGAEPGQTVLLKSPEDTILRKLEWYRRGDEVSERQWQDVLSILAAMRGQLDEQHLDRWSRELRVADLLDRARREAGDW